MVRVALDVGASQITPRLVGNPRFLTFGWRDRGKRHGCTVNWSASGRRKGGLK